MNVMKKSIIFAAAIALCAGAGAREMDDIDTIKVDPIYTSSHFGFYGGGGVHSFISNPENGSSSIGAGFLGGIQYQYFFNDNFGLGIGAQVSKYNSKVVYDAYSFSEEGLTHPDNGMNYTRNTEISEWTERQSMLAVEIPIQALYETPMSGNWKFQAGLGATLIFPVSSTFETEKGYMKASGIFPEINPYTPIETPAKYGFGSFENAYSDANGDITNMKSFGLGLQADLGFRYDFNQKLGLYTGLYFDYGVMNVIEASEQEYSSWGEEGAIYNSAFDCKEVSQVNPFEFGLKLGLRFNIRDKKAERAAKEQIAAQRAEEARLAAEKAAREAEEARLAAEKAAREKAEAERLAREAEEKAKAERFEKVRYTERAGAFKVGQVKVETDDNCTVVDFETMKQSMADYPESRVVLTGHTDNTGSEEGNMKLGLKRAENYRDIMVENDFDAERIDCQSEGQNNPIADNSTREGRKLNRRVTVELKK